MKLSEAKEILEKAGIPDPLREARLIFSNIGNIPPWQLVGDDPKCDTPSLLSAISRRANREPLQYILGEVSFYREKYKVTPACLIPREDTEVLVDYAIKNSARGARFLDLCTGSGCIAISVLANTEKTEALAIDISNDAIALARENAKLNHVAERVRFLEADILSEGIPEGLGKFDFILSNPPYIRDTVYQNLEREIFHEPKAAFLGGEDGGVFYRAITPKYKPLLNQDGFIAYEIGYDQKELIQSVALENDMSAKIIKDLSGNARVAVLTPRCPKQ